MMMRKLGLVLLAFGLSAPVFALDENASCAQVKAYVDELPVLPKDLKSFSELGLSLRKEVFARLSGAERAALWNAHLDTFESRLNPRQKEALKEVRSFVTAKNFARAKRIRSKIRNELHLASVFKSQLFYEMFGVLGAPVPIPSEAADVLEGTLNAGSRNPPAQCLCSSTSDYCNSGGGAHNTGPYRECWAMTSGGCASTSWGCGTFFAYPCNGKCVTYEQ